jgi:hypothetical protein
MSALPVEVAQAFLKGKTARAGQFISTGGAILSYAMPLAHKAPDGTVVLDYQPLSQGGDGVSVTTNRHMRALEVVLDWESIPFCVEAQPLPEVETGGNAYIRR